MKYQFKAKIQLGPHVVTLDKIALYSDGDIGVSSEYLESKLPSNHIIDWHGECIRYDDEEGQIYENVLSIMPVEDYWVQIDGDKVEVEMVKPRRLNLIDRLEEYAEKYEVNLQVWGKGKFAYFLEKGGVHIRDRGGFETYDEMLTELLEYLDRVNNKVAS